VTKSADCSLERITATIAGPAQSNLLTEWCWLTGPDKKLFTVSLSGDGFLNDSIDMVWWLNTGEGKLSRAASLQKIRELLEKKRESAGVADVFNSVSVH